MYKRQLFRLAGADAVKKQTTRAEQGCGCFEQGQLNPGQADQVCRTATPFQLRQAADHAEAAAGDVYKRQSLNRPTKEAIRIGLWPKLT